MDNDPQAKSCQYIMVFVIFCIIHCDYIHLNSPLQAHHINFIASILIMTPLQFQDMNTPVWDHSLPDGTMSQIRTVKKDPDVPIYWLFKTLHQVSWCITGDICANILFLPLQSYLVPIFLQQKVGFFTNLCNLGEFEWTVYNFKVWQ